MKIISYPLSTLPLLALFALFAACGTAPTKAESATRSSQGSPEECTSDADCQGFGGPTQTAYCATNGFSGVCVIVDNTPPPPPPVCTHGAVQCVNDGVATCGASGQWGAAAACPYACVNGACTGVCKPGAGQCSGLQPQTCDSSGQWQAGSPCPYSCVAGKCSGECTPGAIQCQWQNKVQTCTSDAHWHDTTFCSSTSQTCVNGACAGVCQPGQGVCSGNSIESCGSDGQWTVPVACDQYYTCQNYPSTAHLPVPTAVCVRTSCPPPMAFCKDWKGDSYCSNLSSAHDDCGACGKVCAIDQSCSNGTCSGACPNRETICFGSCVDLRYDQYNCGYCGHQCSSHGYCDVGLCR